MVSLIAVALFIKLNRDAPVLDPPSISEPTLDDSLESITEESCRRNLEYLASDELEGRMSGKRGNVLAAEFIKNHLREKYPFARSVTGRGSGGSDHASFHNKKVPVAFIHTGSHKHYHTPSDDVETIDMAGVAEVSKYAIELVWRLASQLPTR